MNLNATLFAQTAVFIVLAIFTAKFVWPPLRNALDERAKKIAEGLAAADRSKQEMVAVERHVQIELAKAREEGQRRLSEAQTTATKLADEIKQSAEVEATQIVEQAKAQAEAEVKRLRESLRNEVAILAVKGAEQILKREVDASAHAALLKQLADEL
ncbi:MAG: F0F1 ATP synthase subunit B [Alistipes senegalensis]|nr:F0F1 ATP synthase subunit B [Oxalobacter formigenes]MCM1280416.1 F0F1 ATP synthase subunit B [Alistipes senegalensis]